MKKMQPKIFCIGLNKTGTSSMHAAFEVLGLKSLHDSYKAGALIEAAIQGNYQLLHYLEDYNAFSDYPFFRYYKELDIEYPGSKFILNTRDINGWLKSRISHDAQWNKANPTRSKRIVDETVLAKFFRSVHDETKSYFDNRTNDFIVFDVAAGDGWVKLCRFIDKPIPVHPFPHVNQSDENIALAQPLL